METILTIYVLGCLAVASMLMAWFGSGLPLHAMHMLRRLGYKKGSKMWEEMGEWTSTWEDFSVVTAAYISPFAGELITCPICLSFHLSFWLSLLLCLVSPAPWWMLPAATATWPVLSNIIKNIVLK